MPCQTVTVQGEPPDVNITSLDLVGGQNKVDVSWEVMNNTDFTAVVTLIMGIDQNGDGEVTRGSGEVAREIEHTISPNSPIHWNGDFPVEGVMPGETAQARACVKIDSVEFQ